MQIYLPIAELPVNVLLILFMGLAVGFISGMFGIGGGFLMTPLLIFVGIAPAVAVASVASHVAASSFSGAISYWRRRALDPALALVLLTGGLSGTTAGVWLFTLLRAIGQLDLTIALSYLILLGAVGTMMIVESVRAILFEDTRDLRLMGGYQSGRDAELDQAIALVPKVYDALRQGPTDALSSDAFRELNVAIKQSKA